MWKKIWKHRLEFYPYFSMYGFWFFGAFLGSLLVQNRPGITALGLITIPSIILITIAAVKTYRELPNVSYETQYQHLLSSQSPHFNKRFGYAAYGLLVLVIVCTTYLHHFQPQVFRVPSNTNVSSWQSPPFEQTLIYDRITGGEKEKLNQEGVVWGTPWLVAFLSLDFWMILLGILCFLHALKYFGFWMASCFFIGSFVFTGIQESMWIIPGRLLSGSITNPIGDVVWGSYWFTKAGFWFFETPVGACLVWFCVAYSCVMTAGKVFPKMGLWGRAIVGGLIAMGIDMWLDPVQTSPEIMNWVWAKADFFLFFGIPMYNFIGWFLLITIFAIIWEKLPAWEKRWGTTGATIRFLPILLIADVVVQSTIIIFWFVICGNLFSLVGVTHIIQIPVGW
jgi:hypothetical protein